MLRQVAWAGGRLAVMLAVWLTGTAPALAWGPLGHQTIAVIAETNLTPAAREYVKARLGNQSLADVASWADAVVRDPQYLGSLWYHFEKIPDGMSYLDNLRAMPDWQWRKGGVVEAILVANATLRDAQAVPAARKNALMFLVHLVGDIHQPLHTGRPADRGGVNIKLDWYGTTVSLHRVWDTGLLLTGHRDLFPNGISTRAASRAYADDLIRTYSRKAFTTEMDVEGWLNESLAIRPAAYDPDYVRNPDRYQRGHLEQIDGRIYVAGLRLARLLNDIAAGNPVPAREIELWNSIDNILGDPRQFIHLQPRETE